MFNTFLRFHRVQMYLVSEKLDIVCMTETWLTDNHSDESLDLESFTIFRKDRDNGKMDMAES